MRKRILLVGASGLVGSAVLAQALRHPGVDTVVAPTRHGLPAREKLLNPQVDFDDLPRDAAWWRVDAVICALGTTIRQAGSRVAFRKVDHGYPLAVAQLAQAHGARTYAFTSASGANSGSVLFYSRTKGEVERDLAGLGFDSMTFVRPALLGGERATRRPLEQLGMRVLGSLDRVLPHRYRVVPASRVAATLLEAALSGRPGLHVVESDAMVVTDPAR